MVITLEKIDLIRERTGYSYSEANELLERHDGDVVKALMEAEESVTSEENHITKRTTINSKSDDMLQRIKELIREGNVSKITVKKGDEVVVNIPVNAGAIGFLIAPYLGAVGVASAYIFKYKIEVTKADGEVLTFTDLAGKTVKKVKDTFKR